MSLIAQAAAQVAAAASHSPARRGPCPRRCVEYSGGIGEGECRRREAVDVEPGRRHSGRSAWQSSPSASSRRPRPPMRHWRKPSGSVPGAAAEKPSVRGIAGVERQAHSARPTARRWRWHRRAVVRAVFGRGLGPVQLAAGHRQHAADRLAAPDHAVRAAQQFDLADRRRTADCRDRSRRRARRHRRCARHRSGPAACSASAPRTRMPVKLPSPPLRVKVTPGRRSSTRVRSGPWIDAISSRADRRRPTARSRRSASAIRGNHGDEYRREPSRRVTMSPLRRVILRQRGPAEASEHPSKNRYFIAIPPAHEQNAVHGERPRTKSRVHAAFRYTPPGCGTTVTGRSPGSRIAACPRLPGPKSKTPGPVACGERHSPVTVAGAASDFLRIPS